MILMMMMMMMMMMIHYYFCTQGGHLAQFNLLQLRNGKREVCNHGVMDARGRLLSTKEA